MLFFNINCELYKVSFCDILRGFAESLQKLDPYKTHRIFIILGILAEHPKASIGIGIAVGIGGAIAFAYYYRKKLLNTPPKKWRKIGDLTELFCFPIKSAGCIRLDSLDCSEIGLQNGNLRDRIFMVVRTNGEFITGRGYPKLVQITPKIDGDEMTLSAPGMLDLKLNIKRLYSLEPIKANVWSQTVSVVDAGEDVARWLSRYLLSEDFGLRLVLYFPKKPTREMRPHNKVFPLNTDDDTGFFSDPSLISGKLTNI